MPKAIQKNTAAQTAGQKAAATKAANKVVKAAPTVASKPAAKAVPAKAAAKAKPAPVKASAKAEATETSDATVESAQSIGRKEVANGMRAILHEQGFALPEKIAIAAVSAVEHVISNTLASGQDIVLPGFGKFKTSVRPARTGRNPRNGEPTEIAESIAVAFKPGKALKDSANGRGPEATA
jgi:DNA-binding protein HU-beta